MSRLLFLLLVTSIGYQTPARAEQILHVQCVVQETDRDCGSQYSEVGAELSGLGVITEVAGRLDDLDASSVVNITATISGAVVTNFVFGGDLVCAWEGHADYAGGVLRIYENTDGLIAVTDPGSFSDGTLLLEGQLGPLHGLYGYYCDHTEITTLSGTVTLTGGSLLDRFSASEREWMFDSVVNLDVPNVCLNGFFGMIELDLSSLDGVPVEKTSWGRLKQLY